MRASLLLASTLALAGCGDAPSVDEAPPRPVAWTTVTLTDTAGQRRIPGVIASRAAAPLAFEVPGVVASVEVEIGDAFTAGDVLATLDARSFALQLTQREAQLAEARANHALAASDHARAQRLVERGAVSRAQYDAARAALDTARSRIATLQAQVDLARKDLADTRLVAPYAGTVTRRLVEPAQRVTPATPALHIQGHGPGLEVNLTVPETLIDQLRMAGTHQVHLPALGTTHGGQISEIGTDAAAGSSYPVTLLLTQPPSGARAGMTAEVILDTGDGRPRLTIPVTAFANTESDDPGTAHVYVLEPDGADEQAAIARRRSVTLAGVTGQHAIVADGLSADEPIVSRGVAFLADGQRVARLDVGPRRFAE